MIYGRFIRMMNHDNRKRDGKEAQAMTEPQQLCILVTLHPGGMTKDQYECGCALNLTEGGYILWDDGDYPASPARWHIVESELVEAVRAALVHQRRSTE